MPAPTSTTSSKSEIDKVMQPSPISTPRPLHRNRIEHCLPSHLIIASMEPSPSWLSIHLPVKLETTDTAKIESQLIQFRSQSLSTMSTALKTRTAQFAKSPTSY